MVEVVTGKATNWQAGVFSGFLAVALAFSGAADAAEVSGERVTKALEQLDSMAAAAVTDGGVPGLAIAVVYKDEVVFLKGYGQREAGKPETVNADTVFQLASLSKPLSATVVAALVSDGVVRWDTPVSTLDPAFQLYNAYPTEQVTVRDLFAHRSGLPGDAGNELEDLGFDRDTILNRLRHVPPASSFRAGYSYSNFGLTEGALAAAKPTGKLWEDVAQEKLYGPLGMRSTSSRYADFLARDNRAALHIGSPKAWEAKLTREPDAQSPAGGVSSSARDLAQWARLELASGRYGGQQLIAKEALDATHVPLMPRGQNPVTDATSFYGLGWNVEFGRHGLNWGHAGAFSTGARTLVSLYPESDIGIVVLSNAFPTGVPEGLADSFFDLVFSGEISQDWSNSWNAIYGNLFAPATEAAKKQYATPPNGALRAMPLTNYVGTYANAYIGEVKVVAEDGKLELQAGPGGRKRYPLTHFSRDTFLSYPLEESSDTPAGVTFMLGSDGQATQVTLESLNSFGMGTLQRVATEP